MSIKRWGTLFSYAKYEPEADSEDGIARFYDVVMLRDFNRAASSAMTFDQVDIDVRLGTISFGNFVDCPTSECGKTAEFTSAFELTTAEFTAEFTAAYPA